MSALGIETQGIDHQVATMSAARRRTLALVEPISEDDLVRVHSPLMSPLVWDLGHIAAFEDLWLVHRFGGRPMVRGDLATVYDAFETPRADRGDLPFLGPSESRAYLAEVREQAVELARDCGMGDGKVHEMVLRHEHQHCETMLQTIQLARLEGYAGITAPQRSPLESTSTPATTEFVEVPAGPCTIGASATTFAYDNERPRHRVEIDKFQIGRTQVTNGSYLEFVASGGYRRREWWSDEGWDWRERHGVERPGGWSEDLSREWRLGAFEPIDPARPVVHVSFHEADAFARARSARLPTELEWEKAATWDLVTAQKRPYPWGNDSPVPGHHANLDQGQPGPVPIECHPAGASPSGCEDMIGQVWEWTASPFAGYPGFKAHPYKEYSEVFFGEDYRVLRGGSWATRARVANPTFRNWDRPERRQIFAGVRLAR
jgi:gamma-glutamyl hercynylcysteine S-oxide synthase